MVGFADREQDKVKTFSQGMKQRLGIAVALIHNPRLIILDEPTNGLDPQGIADMRNLILHLSRHLHKTVIVSSHLLNEIEQISTRMLIIDKGKKMAEGMSASLIDPAKTMVEVEVDRSGCRSRLLETHRMVRIICRKRLSTSLHFPNAERTDTGTEPGTGSH